METDNAELVEAREKGIPTLSYPEALGIISKDYYTIAVSGTDGKTTTTAMLAKVFEKANLDPTVIIGSLFKKKAILSLDRASILLLRRANTNGLFLICSRKFW